MAALRGHRVDRAHQRLDRVGVVAIVGDQRGAAVVEHVEAARRGLRIADETPKPGADLAPLQAQRPGGRRRRHRVVDLEADRSAERQWHLVERHALLGAALDCDQMAGFDEHDPLAPCALHRDDRLVRVGREEDHRARAALGHRRDQRVGCVEHRRAVRPDVLDDHALDGREFFDRRDVVEPEMVASADVGDHGDVAAVECQAFAQHAAARRLEDSEIDVRVHQHAARAARAAAVAGVDPLVADVYAVGIRHADALASVRGKVRDQPHRGRLAVGAGDRDYRNSPVVAVGEHRRDDRLADRAALAERRRQVHSQAGRRVDFDDPAALRFERFVHVAANHVGPADVEPDRLGSRDHPGSEFRMHIVGHVRRAAAGAQVRVVAQDHAGAVRRNRFGREALRGEPGKRNVVEPDLRQRRGMSVATARIGVDLVDEFADRAHAVADDKWRIAASGRDELVADHKQPEVLPGQVLLDQDLGAMLARSCVCGDHLLARADVDRDPLALVAVTRLDDDRRADFAGGLPGVVGVFHRAPEWHRDAGAMQQ